MCECGGASDAAELRAENERLRDALAGKERYEEEAERQFSEHAEEWGRITAERDAAEARLEAVNALCASFDPTRGSGRTSAFVNDIRAALSVCDLCAVRPGAS